MKKSIIFLAFLFFISSSHSVHAADSSICTARSLTLQQTKYAITQGGFGTGIILGTRNPATGQLEISPNGDAVVRNDTNCPLPISLVSYSIDNPSDPSLRMQTFYAASQSRTYVPAHSSATLHVNVPPCNYQVDFFYGDNYSQTNHDRYSKSDYFLEAGYIVNLANAGGRQCPTTPIPSPSVSPTPPPAQPPYVPPTYYPPYNPPPVYIYQPYNPPPQIIQTYVDRSQYIQYPQYIPLEEIPYTGLNDYPLIPLYTAAFVFWGIVTTLYIGYRKILRNR